MLGKILIKLNMSWSSLELYKKILTPVITEEYIAINIQVYSSSGEVPVINFRLDGILFFYQKTFEK